MGIVAPRTSRFAQIEPGSGIAVAVAKNRVTAGDYSTFVAVSAVVANA